ncbi:MAG: hypothetical protein ABS81_06550 [Pseudonocardia sp. SCN 72-86]|nr:MAG: hypothetical protein ABS81_06550 [Pseudonocardia sp. SCN 72-86]
MSSRRPPTRNAAARSPRCASGIATTAASAMSGWATSRVSTSSALIFSPPRLTMSLIRPSIE